jgi:hypothetical protein
MTFVTGCSAPLTADEFSKYLADPKAPRLAVQVCLPDKTAYFDDLTVDVSAMPTDLSVQARAQMYRDARSHTTNLIADQSANGPRELEAIRQWITPSSSVEVSSPGLSFGKVSNSKGIVSDSGNFAELADSTESNQAIYSAFTFTRLSDVVAIHIDVQTSGARKTYWFKPPATLKADGYSAWLTPISEEGPMERARTFQAFWLLTHGKEMPMYQVHENAPRIRYFHISEEQYWKLKQDGRRAIDAVKLQRLHDDLPIDNQHIYLLPAKHATVPSC